MQLLYNVLRRQWNQWGSKGELQVTLFTTFAGVFFTQSQRFVVLCRVGPATSRMRT
jgi:hypothetical protein